MLIFLATKLSFGATPGKAIIPSTAMATWFTVVSLSARLKFRNGLQVDPRGSGRNGRGSGRNGPATSRDGVSGHKLSRLSESDSKVRGVILGAVALILPDGFANLEP